MKPPSKPFRARQQTPVRIQLGQATRALRTISACNQVLVRATDEPTMLHDVCRAIVTEGGYRLVWVGYAEHDERKSVRPVANYGYEHGYLETVGISWADVPKGRGPTGTAIRQKRPVVCRDVLKDPNYLPWRDEARCRGYASSIVLPLLSDGDPIGALNIYATEPDAFDANETKLLTELADDLAFAVGALRTRQARGEAEAESRRNAALLRQTEEISHVGGWEYDVAGRRLVWSDETYRIHDLAPGGDECTMELALGFYPNESRHRLAEALARAIEQGESYDLELPLVTAKGRRIWVRTIGRTESRDGKVVRVFGNIIDVTERMRSFAALQAERQRFIDVLDKMPAYVVLLTPDYHVPFANRFFEQRFGRALGRRCYEYLFNLSEPCKACRTFDVLKTKAPLQWEWLGPDGRNYDIHDFPFTDTDGSALIMEVGLDVTDIRKAREELSRASAYNRSLLEAGLDPLVTIGPDGRIMDVNAATETTTGCTRAELIGTDFSGYFTEPAKARAGYEQVFRDGFVRDYPLELRHRDGRITSVLYNASVYRDEHGQVTGVFAAARDITERKRANEALRRSEGGLKEAQRLAHLGSWELDLVHNVLTWSDEIYRLFELDPHQFGASYEAFLDAVHPDDREAVNRAYTESVKHRTPYSIVHRLRLKDGRIKHVQERCETTYDESGTPLRSFGTVQDITERKRAEETAARLAAIVESTDDAVISKDLHGVILSWNRAAERLYGYTATEAVGQTMTLVVPPDRRDELVDFLHRIARGERIKHYETVRLRKNGQLLDVSVTLSPIHDAQGLVTGASAVVRDITERKQAEEALRRANLYNRSLIEASLDPLVTIGPDGRITDVNAATETATGRPRGELIGTDFCSYFTEPAKARAGYEQVFRDGFVRDYPLELRHRDGRITSVHYNASVYRDERGRVTGVFAAARDITERKHAEEEIRRLNASLEQRVRERTRELETANKELESFAYSVSHDLRAPLRAIDGFSRILLRDSAATLGDAGRENLRHVREASQHMGQLIDDMLQLSRTSRAAIRRSPINLSQLAETILADLRQAHPERRVACTVAPGLLVNADPTLMRATLENLLGNAWKFTSRVAEACIEFGVDTSGAEPVFFVRDNGAGFDMAYADRLFGPFQRLHSVGEFPGTGVGLATVQRIIHRHGGRLWAEARVNAGATFFFTLPAPPDSS